MNKREWMSQSAVLALAAVAGKASAQENPHSHHHMTGSGLNPALIAAASDCAIKGQICLSHCLDLLAGGEKEMLGCGKAVSETIAVCNALQALAIQGARSLKAMAKLAEDTCLACEKECRKHEDKHKECKDCAESCVACAKECKALTS
jgi:Cys-rich four helix bundle protein (predicted Tat secretion target)